MTHNKRFPEMWKIISERVDFKNKIIIDAGCGGGDFTLAVANANAKRVYAIDYDEKITKRLADITKDNDNIIVCRDDINGWNDEWHPSVASNRKNGKVDILSCFSVLPYLDNPDKTIKIFAKMANTVLIECQYFGDGPGLDWLMNDVDMELWLRDTWSNVEIIGKTYIPERKKYRMIWMCK